MTLIPFSRVISSYFVIEKYLKNSKITYIDNNVDFYINGRTLSFGKWSGKLFYSNPSNNWTNIESLRSFLRVIQ